MVNFHNSSLSIDIDSLYNLFIYYKIINLLIITDRMERVENGRVFHFLKIVLLNTSYLLNMHI